MFASANFTLHVGSSECNNIEILNCGECNVTFFGSEEMLLHEPEASAITLSNLPKESQCTNHSAISVLLCDTITELLLKTFFLCKL